MLHCYSPGVGETIFAAQGLNVRVVPRRKKNARPPISREVAENAGKDIAPHGFRYLCLNNFFICFGRHPNRTSKTVALQHLFLPAQVADNYAALAIPNEAQGLVEAINQTKRSLSLLVIEDLQTGLLNFGWFIQRHERLKLEPEKNIILQAVWPDFLGPADIPGLDILRSCGLNAYEMPVLVLPSVLSRLEKRLGVTLLRLWREEKREERAAAAVVDRHNLRRGISAATFSPDVLPKVAHLFSSRKSTEEIFVFRPLVTADDIRRCEIDDDLKECLVAALGGTAEKLKVQ